MNCLRRHICWQSKRFYWETVPRWRAGGVREPRRTALSHGLQSPFYGDGISFRVVLSQSFSVCSLVQPRWMPERRILGRGWTGGVSFCPFPNSSGWGRLISSLFLTRISCPNTAHANGYCGAWPGWAVSISVLPLTNASTVCWGGTHFNLKHSPHSFLFIPLR